MLKVVLDTNCLLVAAPRRSQYHWFYQLLKTGEITLAVTTEILAEYEEQLANFYSPNFADLVLKTLLNLPEYEEVTVYYKWHLITNDPDDNKFADTSIASNADFLVTHDGHFKVLRDIPFPLVPVVSLKEFHLIYFGVPMPELE